MSYGVARAGRWSGGEVESSGGSGWFTHGMPVFLLTWHMNNGMTAYNNDSGEDHWDKRGDVMFSYGTRRMYRSRISLGFLSDFLGRSIFLEQAKT